MTRAPVVFLDANVLFSASLGSEVFDLVLDLGRRGRVSLVTSAACELEARQNVERKRADRLTGLDDVLAVVKVEDADPAEHAPWASDLVNPTDVHVLAAARALGASVLVTGDITHFGPLMERGDLPLVVRTPRSFLLEGPPEARA